MSNAAAPGGRPDPSGLGLRAGDWVEVRSKEEILATLDENGRLDQLPFMPPMFEQCGKRLRVWKRAHKTCDTVNRTGGRRMADTVHLEESRCDGKAHGGCEAACLIFWKEAWLKRADGPAPALTPLRVPAPAAPRAPAGTGCTEADVLAGTRASGAASDPDTVYICQATQLPQATTPLPWWDLRQYWEDWRSGNASLRELAGGAVYVCFFFFSNRGGPFLGRLSPFLIRLYERWQALTGGVPYPRRWGTVPAGQKTPDPPPLGLKPGELVRVKGYREILDTLDARNKNRGLYFDAEEVPYCGKTLRVRSAVTRIIDERTGKMRAIKGNTVILEGAICRAFYSDRRMFCPRAIYSFWRETWLERVEEPLLGSAPVPSGASTPAGPT